MTIGIVYSFEIVDITEGDAEMDIIPGPHKLIDQRQKSAAVQKSRQGILLCIGGKLRIPFSAGGVEA